MTEREPTRICDCGLAISDDRCQQGTDGRRCDCGRLIFGGYYAHHHPGV